ncbi:NAD(P)H-binding protein [Arsenicibacter rosenii]|uniref:NAD-dependent dehydratase n=1 Tax=Arsenicibacter rosenii TaxID=1750698 RepID=A0A1S2VBV5_9BACT|nr:NAD(P)H-binding protein [Arsenicibacter rosenii]OIN55900.1 NAD-dependent dehydratase [Arsenicibacter rosenii]
MKYTITGSLGHISKPIVEGLVKAGHEVTVITSKPGNAGAIESIGATAAIGDVADQAFVEAAFAGADAVYLMIPPKSDVTDWRGHMNQVADNYIGAIRANDIRFAVVLSSIGAHLGAGCGPVDGLYDLEQKLKAVDGLSAKILRPSYFFYNLFAMIPMIKHMGITGSNFGGPAFKLALVHTNDIAAVALQELLNLDFTGHQIRYIVSDEVTTDEIAGALGAAAGKPETPWVVFTDEQQKGGMLQAGLNEEVASNYTAMGEALRTGKMQEDYWANRTGQLGKVKLADFAQNEFAPAFQA